MDQSFVVPSLGVEITEGVIRQWLKKEGDTVQEGDLIVTVGTSKLDMEVESPFSGTLTAIKADIDDVVNVGDEIAIIRV